MHEVGADAVPLGGFLAETDRAQPQPAPRPVEPDSRPATPTARMAKKDSRHEADWGLQEAGEASLITPPGVGRR